MHRQVYDGFPALEGGKENIWSPLSIETARRRRAAAGADLTRGRRLEFRTTGWKLAGIRLPGANYATH